MFSGGITLNYARISSAQDPIPGINVAALITKLRAPQSETLVERKHHVQVLLGDGIDIKKHGLANLLLNVAYEQADRDLAQFLVEHGANPYSCTPNLRRTVWFASDMEGLFNVSPHQELNSNGSEGEIQFLYAEAVEDEAVSRQSIGSMGAHMTSTSVNVECPILVLTAPGCARSAPTFAMVRYAESDPYSFFNSNNFADKLLRLENEMKQLSAQEKLSSLRKIFAARESEGRLRFSMGLQSGVDSDAMRFYKGLLNLAPPIARRELLSIKDGNGAPALFSALQDGNVAALQCMVVLLKLVSPGSRHALLEAKDDSGISGLEKALINNKVNDIKTVYCELINLTREEWSNRIILPLGGVSFFQRSLMYGQWDHVLSYCDFVIAIARYLALEERRLVLESVYEAGGRGRFLGLFGPKKLVSYQNLSADSHIYTQICDRVTEMKNALKRHY